jgi:hypothetical protein
MSPESTEAFVDAAAATLGLALQAEHRPGVLHYFALAAAMAELVNGLPLTILDEPAEVFTPISPDPRSTHGMAQQ